MILTVKKSRGAGEFSPPASKSISHRVLIAAALSEGVSVIGNLLDCADLSSTLAAVRALGAEVELSGTTATVKGGRVGGQTLSFSACESGSTLRFLIPVICALGYESRIKREGTLISRPLSVYEDLLAKHGATLLVEGDDVLTSGRLCPGVYELSGGISSQFVSGLLFALPLLDGDSTLRITPPFESAGYARMTVAVLKDFGITIEERSELEYFIRGNQTYTPCSLQVEGDLSSAAYVLGLNLLGSSIRKTEELSSFLQPDGVYTKIFEMIDNGYAEIDLSQSPDLGPIVFALLAARGGGRIKGIRRLRLKESDRVGDMLCELKKLGADFTVGENEVEIKPSALSSPKTPLSSHRDHRIAMALTVLLTALGGELTGAECVDKSYPTFFSDLKALGIMIKTTDEG